MLSIKVLLVVPALAALAMPVVDRADNSEVVHPDFWKREDATVHPDFWKREEINVRSEFWKKREDAAIQPDFWKRDEAEVHPDFWKRSAPVKERHLTWRHRSVQQPAIPSFIDTGACICGLLTQESTLPDNGEVIEMWRCEANLSESVAEGSHGKWYNTSLPSQELSGLGEPRNWGGNPPDLSAVFVLVHGADGSATYQPLNSSDSNNLVGNDTKCTGSNDTAASAAFYASQ